MEDLKTPWKLYIDRPDPHSISSFEPTYNIRDDEGDFVVCDIPKDRAERIIACVNALDGLNPEGIPGLVEAVEKFTYGYAAAGFMANLKDALAKVKS